jgi:iron complex outermembrane recepter protein
MVSKSYRSTLVNTTSALALAVTAAVPAYAQNQQAQGGGLQLEEIIVNARRVDENIQRVPIAITAFTPEKLQAQDVKDIWTLTKNIGGVNICCSPGNTSFIFVRGIGNGTPTYFNDVPADSGGFANFFDVSSVQVLKGPQGTLFGQASNAGALVYQPRKPGEVFGGYVNVTAGNYGRRSIDGALDVPIVEDKVLFRMAAQSFYREGFVEDIRTNRALGDQNYYILRPSLIIRPTEDIENYTVFQLSKQKGIPLPFVLTDVNMTDKIGLSLTGGPLASDIRNNQKLGNIGLASFGPTGQALWDGLRDQVLANQINLGPYKVDGYSSGCSTPLGPRPGPGAGAALGLPVEGTGAITNLNYARSACQYSWSRDIFISNTTTWNFADNLSLKNIFGYRNTHSYAQPGDTDGTPLIFFDSGSARNGTVNKGTPTWSDELQLQGTQIFDFIDFTVGTFHTGRQNKPVLTQGFALGLSQTAAQTKTSSKSRGVYGQANFDIGHFSEALEGVSFTAGYRYTWDHVTQVIYSYNPTTLAPLNNGVGLGQPGSITAGAGDGRFSAGVYTFQLQYQVTPDIMVFVNNSKGYSSGGLQNVLGKEKFSPDVLTNYEGGIKGTFDVGGVLIRTATSYFYGDYDNIKVSVTQLANTASAPTAPASLIVVTENAATGYITGLDSDLTVVPTDWLEIGGNLAYTKTKYTKWDNFVSLNPATPTVLSPVSYASTPFSFVPKWKWSLRGTVRLPVDQASIGDMSFTANFTRTGVMYNVAKPVTPAVPGNPNTGITNTRCRTAANGYGPLTVAAAAAANVVCVGVDQNQAYSNLDLNFDWRDVLGNEGLNASVFVTNVTKNIQNDGGCYCDGPLGITSPAPQVPRMFGVKVGYSF